MNGTEAIINKILADAKEKASAIEQTSLYNQSMRERAYNDWKEEYLKEQKAEIKEEQILNQQEMSKRTKENTMIDTKVEVLEETTRKLEKQTLLHPEMILTGNIPKHI